MAKAKPVKTTKKHPLWQSIKFWLRTWISNDASIEGKNKPWYWAILVGILSAIIAVIPVMVQQFTINAADFFESGYNLDYDNSLMAFRDDFSTVTSRIENNQLTIDGEQWKALCKNPEGNSTDYWGYYYKVPVTVKTETPATDGTSASSASVIVEKDNWYCGLAVYYTNEEDAATFAASRLANVLYDPNYQLGHTEVTTYSTNLIVLAKESAYFVKRTNNTSTTSRGNAIAIQWNHADFQGKSLQEITAPQGEETVLHAWAQMLNRGYNATRIKVGWTYTGIGFAVAIGAELFLGFVLWLVTRGKRNPFRVNNLWDYQKISYWASFSPAVIGLFALIPAAASFSMFLYPMAYVIRISWMSMRSLQPAPAEE